MYRFVCAFTLLFFTLLITFASAAPADVSCDGPSVVRRSDYNDSTDSTSDDSTSNFSGSVSTSSATNTMSGRATWYSPGLGACGGTNSASDFIVALSEADWDNGSHCYKQLQITDPTNGKTSTVTAVDMCPGCSSGSLDLSPAVFQALDGNMDDGVFQISWHFL